MKKREAINLSESSLRKSMQAKKLKTEGRSNEN